jgi:hypothetical protein
MRSVTRRILGGLLFLSISLWKPSPAKAQQLLGSITGIVKDTSGAIIPGVRVSVLSGATGLRRSSRTNGSGAYQFFGLPIGTYTVTFAHPSFKTEVHSDVIVQANRTASVDAVLVVGAASTTVTVRATPLLNRVDTTNGYVLSPSVIQAIPLGTGSFTQLAILSPGVNAELLSGSGTNTGLGNQEVWANGQRDTSNSISFNGISADNIFNGKTSSSVGEARFTFNTGEHFLPGGQIQTNTSVYDAIGQGLPTPPPETIQELRVNTSMYDASQGAHSGAHIALITRSGTNTYHGQLYWYHQSSGWNAAPFFYNASSGIAQDQKVPSLHRNVAGGTFGGPLRRNKLFFFGSYQGARDHDQLNGTSYLTVPLRLTGDRSASTLEREFGVSSINPVALNLLNAKIGNQYLIPTPTITNAAQAGNLGYDAVVQGSPSFIADQVNLNLDFNLSDKDRLAEKYYYQRDPTVSPFAISSVLGFPQQLRAGSQVFSLDNSRMMSPSVTWEQKAGFIREIAYANVRQQLSPSAVGMNLFGNSLFPGVTLTHSSTQVGGGMRFGSAGNFTNGGVFQNQFAYSSNVDWVFGPHTLTFGGNFNRLQLNVINRANAAAQITVTNFAGFLQGKIRSTRLLVGSSNRYYRANQAGLYLQDKWRLGPRLSLSYGVRYDYDGPLSEKHGLLTNFDPALYQYNAATDTVVNDGLIVAGNNPQYATKGVSASTLRANQWGFAPRIGIAYSPSFSRNLVFRAGYGLYYDRGEFFTEFSPGAGYGISGPLGVTQELPFVVPYYSPAGSTLSSPLGPSAPSVAVGNPALFAATIPNLTATAGCPAGLMPNPLGCGPNEAGPDTADGGSIPAQIGGYGINNKLPYSENWTADIQWQPSNDLVLTLGYTGNHGVHQVLPIPINQPRIATPRHPVNGQIYSYGYNPCDTAAATGAFAGDCYESQYGPYSPYPYAGLVTEPFSNYNSSFDGGNVDLRVPYVGYSPNMAIWQAEGISNYNALQFSVNKRLSHGLQINGSYTWSHVLDEGSSLGLFYNGNDPSNPASAYGNAGFNRTHVFAFSYLYQLPSPAGANSLAGKFLNGWGLSGITILESGLPFSVWDYSGGVASLYYSSNDVITNPLLPLAAGSTPASTQTTLGGIPGLNPANFALPLVQPGQSGVPPCGPTADGSSANFCDTVETGYGPAGRNNFSSPFQSRFDFSLYKNIKLTERFTLRYQADFFNLFNTPSFDAPNNNSQVNPNYYDFPAYLSPAANQSENGFGLTQQTIGSPRFIQMSLHLDF